MAGSATITGRQNYVLGIGHPKSSSLKETAPSTGAVDASGLYLLPSSVYDESRNEYVWTDSGAVRSMQATFRNPTGVALTNYPCRAVVNFAQGEVFSADQLRVLDSSGTRLPFQWEAGVNPLDESAIGTWSDGSLRSGYVWVNRSIAAGATSRIEIHQYPMELAQSFTQNVVYTAVSGTVDQLEAATLGVMQVRFEDAQAWNLRRYLNTALSFDLFTANNGINERYSHGTDLYSYTAAQVTQVSHGRINTSAFGYGVVFQDYETIYKFTSLPDITHRMRYRVFADGSVQIERKVDYAIAYASRSLRSYTNCAAGATGLTMTVDDVKRYALFSYASAFFVFGAKGFQVEHPDELPTDVYSFNNMTDSAGIARLGFGGTTTTGAGVTQRVLGYLAPCASGDAANEHSRRYADIAAIASRPLPVTPAAYIRSVASEATAVSLDTTWGGVNALISLRKGDTVTALAQYQAWAKSIGVTNPATASQYLSAWTNAGGSIAGGLEYQGRNTQVLWWLREAYRKAGNTTNQALVESYIHAFASACVSMEANSGGAGLIYTQGSIASPSWNAGGSCTRAIATSLAITADGAKTTVMNRITAAFIAGAFTSCVWGIAGADASNPTQYRLTHYEAYTAFEYACAKKINSAVSLPVDMMTSILSMVRADGQINEWYADLLYRRGIPSTQWLASAAAALLNNDYASAYELLRHARSQAEPTQNVLIDGWSLGDNPVPAILQDVRAIIEVANWIDA